MRFEEWPSADGTMVLTHLDPDEPRSAARTVLRTAPRTGVLAVADRELRDALVRAGAVEVRHVHAMRITVRSDAERRPPAGVTLRPWRAGDSELVVDSLLSAYGDGHPDVRVQDRGAAIASVVAATQDPDNPLMADATFTAESGAVGLGASIVVRSEHVEDWAGPWLWNLFRAGDAPPGTGHALLARTLAALAASGEQSLGLAVSHDNPARGFYERVGFEDHWVGWLLALPAGGRR